MRGARELRELAKHSRERDLPFGANSPILPLSSILPLGVSLIWPFSASLIVLLSVSARMPSLLRVANRGRKGTAER